jgi:hypothetical protein
MTTNPAHALDGGIALEFHTARHWPATSERPQFPFCPDLFAKIFGVHSAPELIVLSIAAEGPGGFF